MASTLRWISTFSALLALLGCAPKPVPAEALAYPVLALESHGPVVYPDAKTFCTTSENGQGKYRTLQVMDVRGTHYAVAKAQAKGRSTPWIFDLAGNAPVFMEISLKPVATLDLTQAKAWIAAHVTAHADYLDLLDGGRARALRDLQADSTLDAVFARFAGPFSFKAVIAETQRQADTRDGVPPRKQGRRH